LPALLLKKVRIFQRGYQLPSDLAQILREIRRGRPPADFRGIPAKDYLKWVDRLGHPCKKPTLLKAFRFRQEDLAVLEQLKSKYSENETALVRRALRFLLS